MMKTEKSKMQVQRYVAEDMRRALKRIREELGPDAVILSNKKLPDGSVEILTTLEFDEAAMMQAQAANQVKQARSRSTLGGDDAVKVSLSQAQVQKEIPQGGVDSAFQNMLNQHLQTKASPSVDEDLMAAMRSEIENLRLLLKDQMEHMTQESWSVRNPIEAAILQRFEDLNINSAVAQPIAKRVTSHATIEEAWQAALSQFSKRIPVTGVDQFNRGVVALLGPTGAGKTTTIAKLAIRYALRYGRDSLALVTTDRYRLAAYEQLKALGRIIDVPVKLVDEHTSLNRVLRSLRDKSLVLIDTAGFPASDAERMAQLEELDSANAKIKKLLVLPSISQDSALRAAYDLVESSHVDACVLSKTDETMSFGEVLSLVVEKALPVAYITNGQAIPDDIESAKTECLIKLLGECGQAAEFKAPNMINSMRSDKNARVHAGR